MVSVWRRETSEILGRLEPAGEIDGFSQRRETSELVGKLEPAGGWGICASADAGGFEGLDFYSMLSSEMGR